MVPGESSESFYRVGRNGSRRYRAENIEPFQVPHSIMKIIHRVAQRIHFVPQGSEVVFLFGLRLADGG